LVARRRTADLRTIRTDNVGSLLRPARWKEARRKFDEGTLDKDSFARLEEDCVRDLVRLQESIGLEVVTDGEISRLNFQDSFGLSVAGFDTARESVKSQEKRAEGGTALKRWDIPDLHGPGTPVVHRRPAVARLTLARNVPLEEYRRVKPIATRPVKVTLIGPDRVAQRFDRQGSKAVYPRIEDFMADLVAVQRRMVAELVEAGCPYVHIDAPGYTAYVDEPSLREMRARGEDPWENFGRSLKADAAVIEGFPGTVFGLHLCRGNQRSMWHREGTYDAIAERLFNELPHDRFLLEYDSPRAGSFAPLRFMPKGKVVVLGLISTKVPLLEPVDELKRRIDEAAKYVPLEYLALSPQCGFGSDAVGNLIGEDDQKRKLELMVETARQVWG
jgi:5-methyltetrahydropteroyltriglutamate--homocysteine methyltransferase